VARYHCPSKREMTAVNIMRMEEFETKEGFDSVRIANLVGGRLLRSYERGRICGV
jgi:hypothetical protein